mgnify:CR=1 FL=1
MCGIVGYVGRRDACPILVKGLHRLEYRGYDSAGIALVNAEGSLHVFKCKGKVSDLEHFLAGKDLGGTIGIAHTRWATHGVPNDANAHPHYSESENIALIHNGIIENYRVLKDALVENGYTFRSSTDSEVLVNLIEYVRETNRCSLFEAVQQALRQVVGAYAIAVVEKGNTDRIIAARQSSPMVVGIGEGEYFLSSDAASIIEYTEDFVYIGDGEIAVIERDNINPAYKIMWLLIVVALPVTGAVFYLWWGNQGVTPKNARKFADIERAASAAMVQDDAVTEALYAREPAFRRSVEYLSRNASAPLYCNTQSEYYPMGQDFFARFLEVIRGAKNYIFME